MNWTEAQLKEVEQRIQSRCPVRKVEGKRPVRLSRPRKARGAHKSYLEDEFMLQIQGSILPMPVRQFKAIEKRKFLIDFAWPSSKVCVLVQGNVHRIREKFYADCELFCLLTLAGWRYLPVSRNEVQSGKAFKWTAQLLAERDKGG
jgi:very-short-patch-repair endonuclease